MTSPMTGTMGVSLLFLMASHRLAATQQQHRHMRHTVGLLGSQGSHQQASSFTHTHTHTLGRTVEFVDLGQVGEDAGQLV